MFRRSSSHSPSRPAPSGPASGIVARWITRHRRLLAALLFCCAAGLAVHQLTPASAAHHQVVAAAGDLSAGEVLDASSLTLVAVPPSVLPDGTYDALDGLVGEQLAVPLRRGEILTDTALLGPGLLTGAPPGTVAVPIRVTDSGTVQLIRPGERVDVVISSGNGYERAVESNVAADGVVVLWTSAAAGGGGTEGGTGGGWLGSGDAEGLVVLAAAPDEAKSLAGAAARGKVSLVMVKPAGPN